MSDTPATPVAETVLYLRSVISTWQEAPHQTITDEACRSILESITTRLRTLTESSGTSEDELDEAISLIGSLVERNTEKGEYWQGEDEADPRLYAADLWQIILNRLRAPSESSEREAVAGKIIDSSLLRSYANQVEALKPAISAQLRRIADEIQAPSAGSPSSETERPGGKYMVRSGDAGVPELFSFDDAMACAADMLEEHNRVEIRRALRSPTTEEDQ